MKNDINLVKLPSIECLIEVLEEKVKKVLEIKNNTLKYLTESYGFGDGFSCEINIYELAHKCKEKASEKGYSIQTSNILNGTGWYDVWCMDKYAIDNFEDEDVDFFQGKFNTEPTAIFSAFEWILEKQNTLFTR